MKSLDLSWRHERRGWLSALLKDLMARGFNNDYQASRGRPVRRYSDAIEFVPLGGSY